MRVRSRLLVLLTVGALVWASLGSASAGSAPSAWYQGGANQSRTGFNSTESNLVYGHASTLHQVWARSTPVPCCRSFVAQTVSANGFAYYYSAGSELTAVNTATGATRWRTALPECASSNAPPSIHLGVLVVPTSECSPDDFNSYLSGYDANTGRHLWSWRSVDSMSAPVTVNGVASVLSRDSYDQFVVIDAIDVKTGARKWEVHTSGFVSSLAADGIHVYVSAPTTAQALSPATGQVLWTRNVPGGDVLVSAGHVVFGGYLGGRQVLTSFTTAGGRQWRNSVAGPNYYSIAATASVLVTAGGGTVRAIALAGGAARWNHSVVGQVSDQPAIAGGVVYVPTLSDSAANVFALHATDGRQLWAHTFTGSGSAFADTASVSVAAGSLLVSLDGTGVVTLRP